MNVFLYTFSTMFFRNSPIKNKCLHFTNSNTQQFVNVNFWFTPEFIRSPIPASLNNFWVDYSVTRLNSLLENFTLSLKYTFFFFLILKKSNIYLKLKDIDGHLFLVFSSKPCYSLKDLFLIKYYLHVSWVYYSLIFLPHPQFIYMIPIFIWHLRVRPWRRVTKFCFWNTPDN